MLIWIVYFFRQIHKRIEYSLDKLKGLLLGVNGVQPEQQPLTDLVLTILEGDLMTTVAKVFGYLSHEVNSFQIFSLSRENCPCMKLSNKFHTSVTRKH